MKRHLLTTLGLAAALTLTACGAEAGSDAAGDPLAAATPSASEPASATATSASTTDEHNDADVMFAQMMIPHHRQAVEMSELMLAKDGVTPEVVDLATVVRDAQAPEIDTMTGWLEAWGEPAASDGGMEGHDMGVHSGSPEGMMTAEQLAELESAEGDDASRLFLESMTAHHEGAIDMAQEEIDAGQDPDAVTLATSIVESQQAEIDEMEELLSGL